MYRDASAGGQAPVQTTSTADPTGIRTMLADDHGVDPGGHDAYPLSPLQRGMLFNTLADPDSGVDIEQLDFTLEESLDVPAFERAWRSVVARHAVLRTSVHWEGLHEPVQQVEPRVDLPWQEYECQALSASEQHERIATFIVADRLRGFDLSTAPLFRLTVFRCGEANFRVVWTFHHAVMDGRSSELILREVFALYEGIRRGSEVSLPAPRPYRDYIDWLRRQNFDKNLEFWRRALKGFGGPTPLCNLQPAQRCNDIAGKGVCQQIVPVEVTSSLRALARRHDFTLNTVVQGAWAFLLSCYSGETDIVFGVVRTTHRSTVDGAESMIGLLINTLPLRVRVDPDVSVLTWLKYIRRQWMAMRPHEHTPLTKVQAMNQAVAGSSLFHTTVTFENADADASLRKQGETWSTRRFRRISQTNYWLDVAAYDGAELRIAIEFDRRRVDDEMADRLVWYLRMLLETIAAKPDQSVGELSALTPADRHQLLVEWNRTDVGYAGASSTIHVLFEAQVKRTPGAVAIEFEAQRVSYAQLNERANRLAHALRARGIARNQIVGVYADRSVEMGGRAAGGP